MFQLQFTYKYEHFKFYVQPFMLFTMKQSGYETLYFDSLS